MIANELMVEIALWKSEVKNIEKVEDPKLRKAKDKALMLILNKILESKS